MSGLTYLQAVEIGKRRVAEVRAMFPACFRRVRAAVVELSPVGKVWDSMTELERASWAYIAGAPKARDCWRYLDETQRERIAVAMRKAAKRAAMLEAA
ncbi:MAG: hypothetical protein EG825_10335 [Rhodocyclaceae bacterium]|nr:hypothetical protein [Rhodocyclaceae bacterium]